MLGCGPNGKHTALEAVTVVLDLPPPQPSSMPVYHSSNRVSASDPKSALALQKLVQAAVITLKFSDWKIEYLACIVFSVLVSK